MKKLLNTLYITSEDAYLTLDGECIRIIYSDKSYKLIPLHTLESIVCFSYKGASPALMGKCTEKGIYLSFYTPFGKYLSSVADTTNGNVYLRRAQFRLADNELQSLEIAKSFIVGKIHNARYVLLRYSRDHSLRVDVAKLRKAAENLSQYLKDILVVNNKESLRGIEGNAAAEYFQVFDEMILQDKESFFFNERSKRPPLDRVNALLSFAYSLLARDCESALYGVGLDPYVGFMHVDRPGRKSLALDLEEELRSSFADRFVLTLINNRIINKDDFQMMENGVCILNENGRKRFLSEWQKKKTDEITHPFLEERVYWGLVPHIQTLLLSKSIRGDLEAYPPFFWK